MKTFTNWREIGAAMRWARKQHGNQLCHGVVSSGDYHRWQVGDGQVVTVRNYGQGGPQATVVNAYSDTSFLQISTNSAAEILDALAALRLIPARFSQTHKAYLAGRHDALQELGEELTAYQVVQQTGRDALSQGGESRG